jgi:hypothetical protein
VTPDPNDPATKLAQAALDAVKKGDLDAIDRAFKELKPDTRMLTRAYTLCLISGTEFSGHEATRLILNTLQYQLAEKTAQRIKHLTWVLVAFTGVLIVFGVIDICMRLHGCG